MRSETLVIARLADRLDHNPAEGRVGQLLCAGSVAELLKCCIDHNSEVAWEEFVRRFHRTISGAVCRTLRAGGPCNPALVEDLVQDTFVRLCADRSRSMREFWAAEEVYFYGYLRATAVNTVRDHFRRVRSIKRHGDAIAEPLDDVANERAASEEHEARYENALLLQNVDEILRAGDPSEAGRNRLIFWLHYRDGFSAAEIARLHPVGLNAKGVETVLRRLLNEVKRGLNTRFVVTGFMRWKTGLSDGKLDYASG